MLRPEAAARCADNLRRNALEARCTVRLGDLRERPVHPGTMDLVVSNPPYFPAGTGMVSPRADRRTMRTESASLPELCAAAALRLRPGGSFCLVHRTERMGEVFAALAGAGLEPKRVRFFAGRPDRAPVLFFCEARRDADPGLGWEPTLCQFLPQGGETPEYRKICHIED